MKKTKFDSDTDYEFDGELFEMDDDLFSDDSMDFLNGMGEGAKKEVGGVLGFAKNTLKSVKGLAFDILNDYIPDAFELKDSVSMSLSDAFNSLAEKKDSVATKYAQLSSKKSDTKLSDSIKNSFKSTFNNIKSGKFYKSDMDMSDIDMESMFEEEDDDEESYEEEDTSGIMTTQYFKKSNKKAKPFKINVINDNSGQIEAMSEIQRDSVMATARVNTSLMNKHIGITEQNFKLQFSAIKNIAQNVYNIAGFLNNEGSLSLKAALEYDAKSLAFMADQNRILKNIVKLQAKSMGKDIEKEEELYKLKEEQESKNPMSGGMFDFDKYVKNIGQNISDMFGSTTLGFAYSSLSTMSDMKGSMGGMGKMMDPKKMLKSMGRTAITNALLSPEMKDKLERVNNLFGNVGPALMAKANKLKNSDNSVLSFLGEVFGNDRAISKHADLGVSDPNEVTGWSKRSDETLNVVIPDLLEDIRSALTGKEKRYYDYIAGDYRTVKSQEKRYQMVQENAINNNIEFSTGMNAIFNSVSEKNSKGFTDAGGNKVKKLGINDNDLNKGLKIFRDNLIEAREFIDVNKLQSYDVDYWNMAFAGIENAIPKDKVESLKIAIAKSFADIRNQENGEAILGNMNMNILKVGADLEKAATDYKEMSKVAGGKLVLSKLQRQEDYKRIDNDLKYSSKFNSKLINASNPLLKKQADIRAAEVKKNMYFERGGMIDDDLSGFGSGVSGDVSGKVSKIYELLLNGIVVYPSSNMPESSRKYLSERAKELSDFNSAQFDKNKREENEAIALEKESMKNAQLAATLKKTSRLDSPLGSNGILGYAKNKLSADGIADKVINASNSFLGLIYGQDAVKQIVNADSSSIYGADVINELENRKLQREEAKRLKEKTNAKYDPKTAGKFSRFTHGVSEKFSNLNDKFDEKTEKLINTRIEKQANKTKKSSDRHKKVEKWVFDKFPKQAMSLYSLKASTNTRMVAYIANEMSNEEAAKWYPLFSEYGVIPSPYFDSKVDIIIGRLSNDEKKEYGDMIKEYGIETYDIKDSDKLLSMFKNTNGVYDKYMYNRKAKLKAYINRGEKLESETSKFDINAKFDFSSELAESKKLMKERKANLDSINKKISETSDKGELEKLEKLRNNAIKSVKKAASSVSKFENLNNENKYKFLSKINSPSNAAKFFQNKDAVKEIDKLLGSNNEKSVYDFAKKIASKNDTTGLETGIKYLNPEFQSRLGSFMNDPLIQEAGVSIRESIRSPLKEFAYYSVGRTSSEISDTLLKMAGLKDGISGLPIQYRDGTKYLSDTLSSGHLFGTSVDLNKGSLKYDKIGEIARNYGIQWGGYYSNPDPAHFELDNKVKISETGERTRESLEATKRRESFMSDRARNVVDYYKTATEAETLTGANAPKNVMTIREIITGELIPRVERIASGVEYLGLSMGVPGTPGKGMNPKDTTGLKNFVKAGANRISGLAGWTIGVGQKAFAGALGIIQDGAGKVIKVGKSLTEGITNTAQKGIEGLLGKKHGDFSKMSRPEVVKFLVEKCGKTPEELKGIKLPQLIKMAEEESKGSLTKFGEKLNIDKMSSAAGDIVNRLTGGILTIGKNGLQLASDSGKAGVNLVKNAFGGLKTGFTKTKDQVASALERGKEWIYSKKTSPEELRAYIAEHLGMDPKELAKIKGEELRSLALEALEKAERGGKGFANSVGNLAGSVLGWGRDKVSGILGKFGRNKNKVVDENGNVVSKKKGFGLFSGNSFSIGGGVKASNVLTANVIAIRKMLEQKFTPVNVDEISSGLSKGGMLDKVKDKVSSGKKALSEKAELAKEKGSGLLSKIGGGIKSGVGGLGSLMGNILSLPGKAIGGIGTGIKNIGSGLGGALHGLGSGLGGLLHGGVDIAKTGITGLGSLLGAGLSGAGSILKGGAGLVGNTVSGLFQGAGKTIGGLGKGIPTLLGGLGNVVGGTLSGVGKGALGIGKGAASLAGNIVKAPFSMIGSLGSKLFGKKKGENERGQIEGSYEDSISDRKEEAEEEIVTNTRTMESKKFQFIKNIAKFLGAEKEDKIKKTLPELLAGIGLGDGSGSGSSGGGGKGKMSLLKGLAEGALALGGAAFMGWSAKKGIENIQARGKQQGMAKATIGAITGGMMEKDEHYNADGTLKTGDNFVDVLEGKKSGMQYLTQDVLTGKAIGDREKDRATAAARRGAPGYIKQILKTGKNSIKDTKKGISAIKNSITNPKAVIKNTKGKITSVAKAVTNPKAALTSAKGKVVSVGKSVASKGQSVMSFVKDAIAKFCNSPKVQKMFGKKFGGALKKIGDKLGQKVGAGLEKEVSKQATKQGVKNAAGSVPVVGTAVQLGILIGSAFMEFMNGYQKAGSIFNVRQEDLTVPQKLCAGFTKGLKALILGLPSLIPGGAGALIASAIGIVIDILIPDDWLINFVYEHLATEEGKAELSKAREKQANRAAEFGVEQQKLSDAESRGVFDNVWNLAKGAFTNKTKEDYDDELAAKKLGVDVDTYKRDKTIANTKMARKEINDLKTAIISETNPKKKEQLKKKLSDIEKKYKKEGIDANFDITGLEKEKASLSKPAGVPEDVWKKMQAQQNGKTNVAAVTPPTEIKENKEANKILKEAGVKDKDAQVTKSDKITIVVPNTKELNIEMENTETANVEGLLGEGNVESVSEKKSDEIQNSKKTQAQQNATANVAAVTPPKENKSDEDNITFVNSSFRDYRFILNRLMNLVEEDPEKALMEATNLRSSELFMTSQERLDLADIRARANELLFSDIETKPKEKKKREKKKKKSKIEENSQADRLTEYKPATGKVGKSNSSGISANLANMSLSNSNYNIEDGVKNNAFASEKSISKHGSLKETIYGKLKGGLSALKSGVGKIANFIFGNKDEETESGSSSEKLLPEITDWKSGLEVITKNRKYVQEQLMQAISRRDMSGIIDLIKRVKNKNMVGAQSTTAGMDPEFKRRVNAFLSDPEIKGKGVSIREGVRPITSQLAYFMKGRASNKITDAAMKEAGFSSGVGFWGEKVSDPPSWTNTQTVLSNHFNGTAMDLNEGKVGYDRLGKIAAKYGITWGGNWSGFPDKPHFEIDRNWKGQLPSGNARPQSPMEEVSQADGPYISNQSNSRALSSSLNAFNKTSNLNRKNKVFGVSVSGSGSLSNRLKDLGNGIHKNITADSGSLGSSMLESRINDIVSIANEGIKLMEAIHNEQLRHNKVNEDDMKAVIRGLAMIGKMLGAIGSGGSPSPVMGGTSITDSAFDNLAKGI